MKRNRSEMKKLVNAIRPKKKYELSYLAPSQSRTKNYEYGLFKLYGRDLTEKQIIELDKKDRIG